MTMEDFDDFLALVRDELGLPVESDNAGVRLDQIPGWDSVQLLWLVSAVERIAGRRLSLPDVLAASSLEGIYRLATAS
jgi:acyl carrier protein